MRNHRTGAFDMKTTNKDRTVNLSENFSEEYHPAFIGFPLGSTETVDPESGATYPPEWAVEEAREWVNYNEK